MTNVLVSDDESESFALHKGCSADVLQSYVDAWRQAPPKTARESAWLRGIERALRHVTGQSTAESGVALSTRIGHLMNEVSFAYLARKENTEAHQMFMESALRVQAELRAHSASDDAADRGLGAGGPEDGRMVLAL